MENRFKELKKEGRSEENIVIALKEELQHYILHFIYTSKAYSDLKMYGGTVLRIGYGLPRMSEDLDFETGKDIVQKDLAEEMKKHFKQNYDFDIEVKEDNRSDKSTKMFFVKFDNILKELDFETYPKTKIFVRVDINFFEKAEKFSQNIIPVVRDELVYAIKTYPLATLMASKSVAFLTRATRRMGKEFSTVKPRDVFDMMWYMEKQIVPDLDYLKAKGLKFKDFFDFKNAVQKKAEGITENIFRKDLAQFFFEINELESFLENWRTKFEILLNSYKPFKVGKLKSIYLHIDPDTDLRTIVYNFEEDIKVKARLSEHWFLFKDVQIDEGHRVKSIEKKVKKYKSNKITDLELEYIGLFYKKLISFFKRNNNIVFQKTLNTKKILSNSKNIDFENEVLLNKKFLQKAKLEELS